MFSNGSGAPHGAYGIASIEYFHAKCEPRMDFTVCWSIVRVSKAGPGRRDGGANPKNRIEYAVYQYINWAETVKAHRSAVIHGHSGFESYKKYKIP